MEQTVSHDEVNLNGYENHVPVTAPTPRIPNLRCIMRTPAACKRAMRRLIGKAEARNERTVRKMESQSHIPFCGVVPPKGTARRMSYLVGVLKQEHMDAASALA